MKDWLGRRTTEEVERSFQIDTGSGLGAPGRIEREIVVDFDG